MESITSVQNPRIKSLMRLRESSHRKRQQRFLIEGRREVERALAARWPLEHLFWSPHYVLAEEIPEMLDSDQFEECFELSENAFRKISMRERPDGVLAVGKTKDNRLGDLAPTPEALILIAAQIEKPGNIGALLRSADAAGCERIILADPVSDAYNPNAIRASQGAFFSMPIAIASTEDTLLWLQENGIILYSAFPDTKQIVWDCDLRPACAIAVGAEDRGLPEIWREPPANPIHLPMAGHSDSLNVSVAAGILLYEAVRQRRLVAP